MPMPDRNVEGGYRYAFQGQEKDPETGMEAFELRLWDNRLGRWLTTDPYGQFSSPYLGMGNDPINGIDPDGGLWNGFTQETWSAIDSFIIYNTFGITSLDEVLIKGNSRPYNIGSFASPSLISDIWNSTPVRALTGDSFSLSYGGGLGVVVEGEIQAEFTWLLRGPDASFLPYINFFNTGGISISDGGEATVTVSASKGHFNGPVDRIEAKTLLGAQAYLNAGIAALAGVELEVSQSFNPKLKGTFENTWTEFTGGFILGGCASTTAADIQAGVRVNFTRFHPLKGLITIFDE